MKPISYIEDFAKWQSGFSFSVPIKVRFSETDLYGHVNNTSVFVYFEEARIEYLQALGLFNDLDKEKHGFVVADLQCDYLQQMFFNEMIQFHVKVETLGTSSCDIHYMATNPNGEITVTGRGRIVMMDFTTHRSIPIPDEMRLTLKKEFEKQKVT